jgi:hypothetical protein
MISEINSILNNKMFSTMLREFDGTKNDSYSPVDLKGTHG